MGRIWMMKNFSKEIRLGMGGASFSFSTLNSAFFVDKSIVCCSKWVRDNVKFLKCTHISDVMHLCNKYYQLYRRRKK